MSAFLFLEEINGEIYIVQLNAIYKNFSVCALCFFSVSICFVSISSKLQG